MRHLTLQTDARYPSRDSTALPVRRAHQRRALPRLCRTVPRADAEAGRRRDPRQSRLPQGKGGAQGDPGGRSPPRLPAEILPRPQPHRAGLRQVQNSAAKGGSAKLLKLANPRHAGALKMEDAAEGGGRVFFSPRANLSPWDYSAPSWSCSPIWWCIISMANLDRSGISMRPSMPNLCFCDSSRLSYRGLAASAIFLTFVAPRDKRSAMASRWSMGDIRSPCERIRII